MKKQNKKKEEMPHILTFAVGQVIHAAFAIQNIKY